MLLRLLRTHLGPYRKELAIVVVLQLAATIASLYLPSINGLIIEPNVPCRVRSGDELEFGRVHIAVRIVFGAH